MWLFARNSNVSDLSIKNPNSQSHSIATFVRKVTQTPRLLFEKSVKFCFNWKVAYISRFGWKVTQSRFNRKVTQIRIFIEKSLNLVFYRLVTQSRYLIEKSVKLDFRFRRHSISIYGQKVTINIPCAPMVFPWIKFNTSNLRTIVLVLIPLFDQDFDLDNRYVTYLINFYIDMGCSSM